MICVLFGIRLALTSNSQVTRRVNKTHAPRNYPTLFFRHSAHALKAILVVILAKVYDRKLYKSKYITYLLFVISKTTRKPL